MLRFILLSILLTIVVRAVSRLWAGIIRGMQDGSTAAPRPGSRSPQRSVQMSRDPICGTFVVPDRAVTLSGTNGDRVYFCSTGCRDQFVAGQHAGRMATQGRTA
ncbi:MAG: hypothetical protein U0Q55_11225 [Vicinamibacterales bacterium]